MLRRHESSGLALNASDALRGALQPPAQLLLLLIGLFYKLVGSCTAPCMSSYLQCSVPE